MTPTARLLLICPTLAVGGAERQWSLLVPGLREHGFEPRVLTLKQEGRFFEELSAAGIPVACARVRHRFDLAGLVRAYRHGSNRADVVLTQSVDAQLVGHAIARRTAVPHVTAEHGGPGIPRPLHHRILLRLLAPRIDLALAVSESQLRALAELGYRPDRIRVVANGVPERPSSRPREETRRGLELGEDDFVAILAATLRPAKRAHLFVEGVAAAHRRDPRIRGLVAGGGPGLANVRRAAAATGGAVRVLGERDDVPDLIHAADVVCLTSSVEALPMVVLEAMSLSRPILATAVGGIREAVGSGTSGILTPVDDPGSFVDALVGLAGDPARAIELGRGARRAYESSYTVERMIEGYAAALSQALDGSVARPASVSVT